MTEPRADIQYQLIGRCSRFIDKGAPETFQSCLFGSGFGEAFSALTEMAFTLQATPSSMIKISPCSNRELQLEFFGWNLKKLSNVGYRLLIDKPFSNYFTIENDLSRVVFRPGRFFSFNFFEPGEHKDSYQQVFHLRILPFR